MKYSFLFILSFLWMIPSWADLRSPFPSRVVGVSIPNAHKLDQGLFRGMDPKGFDEDLHHLKISDVLIFKNQVRKEVDEEKERLSAQNMTVHHLPFPWQRFSSLEEGCGLLVEALRLISEKRQQGRSVYFHCTVGEDRTGALAGLYRMAFLGENLEKVFKEEMCQKGYERGNPKKPQRVVEAIRAELTPLFLRMAHKIQLGELSSQNLDKEKICDFSPDFLSSMDKTIKAERFTCLPAL